MCRQHFLIIPKKPIQPFTFQLNYKANTVKGVSEKYFLSCNPAVALALKIFAEVSLIPVNVSKPELFFYFDFCDFELVTNLRYLPTFLLPRSRRKILEPK